MTEATFNLTALSQRLIAEKRHLKLAHKIRRSVDIHSLSTDLRMARESMMALAEQLKTPAEPNDHIKLITESALLNNAIVLYARATKTSSNSRGGFDLSSRFDADQKTAHKEICDLRDDAVAHFGPGGTYKGEWQAELAVLFQRGEISRPAVITRRQTVDRPLSNRIWKQINEAFDLLNAEYNATLNSIVEEIEALARDDDDFYLEVAQHPLNLGVFMQSDAAADGAWASWEQGGYAMGSVSR